MIQPTSKYFLCMLTTQVARKIVAYYNRELATIGLTAQQLIALGILVKDDGLSLGQFAERLGVGKSAATKMIKRLKNLELVETATHPHDGRLNVLKVTDKARELDPKLHEKVAELESSIESQLAGFDLEGFVSQLSSLSKIQF